MDMKEYDVTLLKWAEEEASAAEAARNAGDERTFSLAQMKKNMYETMLMTLGHKNPDKLLKCADEMTSRAEGFHARGGIAGAGGKRAMSETLGILKALADDTRLKILRALSERDMYVELLAERLQLSAATVSFHMKKLQAAGLVDSRREQYYIVYSLRKDMFNMTLNELIMPQNGPDVAERLREEMYRRKVIKSFMPDGYCKTLPAQVKKRRIIYEEIFAQFEVGRTYQEKEVNEIISRMHEDYCMVRRAFIGMGWMTRDKTAYTVIGIHDNEERDM